VDIPGPTATNSPLQPLSGAARFVASRDDNLNCRYGSGVFVGPTAPSQRARRAARDPATPLPRAYSFPAVLWRVKRYSAQPDDDDIEVLASIYASRRTPGILGVARRSAQSAKLSAPAYWLMMIELRAEVLSWLPSPFGENLVPLLSAQVRFLFEPIDLRMARRLPSYSRQTAQRLARSLIECEPVRLKLWNINQPVFRESIAYLGASLGNFPQFEMSKCSSIKSLRGFRTRTENPRVGIPLKVNALGCSAVGFLPVDSSNVNRRLVRLGLEFATCNECAPRRRELTLHRRVFN
jgi:hypothetical protein